MSLSFDAGAHGDTGGPAKRTFLRRGSKCKSSLPPLDLPSSREAPSEYNQKRGLNSGMTFGAKRNTEGPQPRRIRDPAKRQSKYTSHENPPGGKTGFSIFSGEDPTIQSLPLGKGSSPQPERRGDRYDNAQYNGNDDGRYYDRESPSQSRRRQQQQQQYNSQIGYDSMDQQRQQQGEMFGRRVTRMSSNNFASGDSQNCGNVLTDRSSTRLLAPPGGHTSINIFGGGGEEKKWIKPDIKSHVQRQQRTNNHNEGSVHRNHQHQRNMGGRRALQQNNGRSGDDNRYPQQKREQQQQQQQQQQSRRSVSFSPDNETYSGESNESLPAFRLSLAGLKKQPRQSQYDNSEADAYQRPDPHRARDNNRYNSNDYGDVDTSYPPQQRRDSGAVNDENDMRSQSRDPPRQRRARPGYEYQTQQEQNETGKLTGPRTHVPMRVPGLEGHYNQWQRQQFANAGY